MSRQVWLAKLPDNSFELLYIHMMEILRIPTSYSIQIQCLSDEDCKYVFKTLFELTAWMPVELEFSPRWGIVQSIWRECIQLENKARSKKWWELLCYDLAPMVQPMVQPKNNLSATKSNQIKSNQTKSNQIKPIDNSSELSGSIIESKNSINHISEWPGTNSPSNPEHRINTVSVEKSEFELLLIDFKNSRAKLKKPMTEKAMELLLKKLSNYSEQEQIAMLEEAIEKGWQSVYPPKQENRAGKNVKVMEAIANYNFT